MSATTGAPAVGRTRQGAPAVPSWSRSLRALVARGLRDQRRAPLVWGGALGAMGALMAAMWPSIEGSVDDLLESYPQGLKDAFGIEELDSATAYIDAEMLSLIVPLALAFFAVRCVTRATVGAEERAHLDTLLALPVARTALAMSAFAVAGVTLAAILAVVWALTSVAGLIVGAGVDEGALAAGLVNVWPLAMAFAGLAVLAAGVLHRTAPVTGIAVGTLVAMYVLDLVGRIADGADALRYVSAFRWYGSAAQHGLDLSHVVGLTLAGTALAVAGALLFDRRDVR